MSPRKVMKKRASKPGTAKPKTTKSTVQPNRIKRIKEKRRTKMA